MAYTFSAMNLPEDKILVVDLGSQYTHLIARKVRECNVYSQIVAHDITPQELRQHRPKGIILSGSPDSVYTLGSASIRKEILELGLPVLGICYGMHLIVKLLGGEVRRAKKGEFGRTQLSIISPGIIFEGLPQETICWMSHADEVGTLPPGFSITASTQNCPISAIENKNQNLYGLQFHPEVSHTPHGIDMIKNFVYKICGCKPTWSMTDFVNKSIQEIRDTVKAEKAVCALSGGVDSSTAAVLVHKAIGQRLICIFVDHGLMREGEPETICDIFKNYLKLNFIKVDASERFLAKLKGICEPEQKRRIIGEEFINVFAEQSKKLGDIKWLVQGTIYPDVVESGKSTDRASRIKTHHNVAGLPETLEFKLIEPLRFLYKDEVRKVAKIIGIPDKIINRHPFPGPGLAVRIIGEVTEEKLYICRRASAIVEEELMRAGLYEKLWQAFAIVGDDRAVGVMGDERRFGYIVNVKVVESTDAMTADWARLPYELLQTISSRITNELPNVTWVNYAISSKPPSTIEPC